MGEIEPVPSIRLPNPELVDVSPDGSTFLVKSYEKVFSASAPLYSVQVVGGSHRYLADGVDATWSPDDKSVAYTTPNGDLNLVNSDGTGAHKLASLGGAAYALRWSPTVAPFDFPETTSDPFGDHLQRFQPSPVARGLASPREVLRPLVA